ncbi:unnamed protein product [Onchocerca ochengi]|uniref:Innexin n=1 Tax=Onchocerca ochengi TaxID=42157 RepID=A0A182EEU5_ONCOC|nr:unnamed protein product [Onchocerca ochengi]
MYAVLDRCNYFYTVLALLFFSLLIGTKQHFGAPIRCLVDRQYSGSWIGYVHDYCFIAERYSLTPPEYEKDEIAAFDPTNEKKYENYYQWVPFLLAAQALAFYVPHFLWKWFQKLSNLDMAIAVNEAIRICNMFADERIEAVKDLVQYLEQVYMIHPKGVRRSFFVNFTYITHVGWYSSLVYVLEKLLYVANTVLQLYVVNTFVGDGTLFWGYQLLKDLWLGRDWTITGHFPRVVYCDYMKHELANVQRKTVQCALVINILNEKGSVCREGTLNDGSDNDGEFCENKLSEDCISNTTSASFHSKIRRRLYAMTAECGENVDIENEKMRESEEQKQEIWYRRSASLSYKNKNLLHSFVCEAIHPDSILLLRFIHSHAGGMVTSDIVFALWADYVESKKSRCKYQSRITNNIAPGAPAWEKNTAVLNSNKCFSLFSPKIDSAIVDADPLLKVNEEYAQVVDALHFCPSAVHL